MTKTLITGASGLIGSHLIDYLLKHTDHELYAIERPTIPQYRNKEVKYYECDVIDSIGVHDVFKEVQPDYIYHLAGQAFFKVGRDNPNYTIDVNVKGTINVLEAIRRQGKKPKKVIIASSGASYGKVDHFPTDEETVFKPLSLYGVSKATQDMIGSQYCMNYDLPTINARFYITIGSRQTEYNAVNAFAKQIAMIEKGLQEYIEVGNLTTKRDITDVRDSVRALYQLSMFGVDGEAYNICSGNPRKIGDILNQLCELTDTEIEIRQSADRMRPSDTPLECGSNHKINTLTGWQPEIAWKDTLLDILDYWRGKVEQS